MSSSYDSYASEKVSAQQNGHPKHLPGLFNLIIYLFSEILTINVSQRTERYLIYVFNDFLLKKVIAKNKTKQKKNNPILFFSS